MTSVINWILTVLITLGITFYLSYLSDNDIRASQVEGTSIDYEYK